ncbi:MAG TPA: hypothetical protein VIG33_14720 [Pseudobdellovibrionaceae bacterium]
MKSKFALASEYMKIQQGLNTSATRYDAFLAGFDSRDAEIAMLKMKCESLQAKFKSQDDHLKAMACESFNDNFKLIELEQEKRNLLSTAETDLMRIAELRDENKYLKERLARYEDKLLGATMTLDEKWDELKPIVLAYLEDGWSKECAFKKAGVKPYGKMYRLCYLEDEEFKAKVREILDCGPEGRT